MTKKSSISLWFERIVTDVRTHEKPHWALLGGLATVGLIVSKPFTQIGDWWSDVAFMVEMHKNKTCNAAETDLRLSFLALVFHQFTSALLTYFDAESNFWSVFMKL